MPMFEQAVPYIKTMKYFLTAIIFALTFNLQKSDYGLKLTVGETYSQTYIAQSTVEQQIMGMEQKIDISINSKVDFTVTQKMADRYRMDVAYGAIEMVMKLPQGETKVSTTEESDNPMSTMMKSMVGKKFQIEMLKNGTVEKVENLENIFSGMFEAFPDFSDQQKQQFTAQMMQSYGEKAFKGNIEMITAILPQQKVAVGDSWNTATQLESGFAANVKSTYTLASANSSEVVIKGTSSIKTDDNDAAVEVNGMSTKYSLDGTMTSTYQLDPKTNWVISGQVEQKMSGKADIEDNPQIPGGITIPMEIKNLMTIGQ